MIQLLAEKYNRHIAYTLLLLFSTGLIPAQAFARNNNKINFRSYHINETKATKPALPIFLPVTRPAVNNSTRIANTPVEKPAAITSPQQKNIGGPSQPEMSSFKPAGTDNMVNLFTGDFSYNIPLLDVGGYPVNIFYDGTVSMEQEASWVGLGWNINPGNINRNTRGVPDDFNGTDLLTETQKMKPNKTWGVSLGADLEFVGIKDMPEWLSASAGVNLGVSFNNYLGPALDFGLKGGLGFKIAEKSSAEKSATNSLKVGIGLGANVNSRAGFTLSPNVSLTASHFAQNRGISNGLSLATSYNSRNGIKALQISDQTSFSRSEARLKVDKDFNLSIARYSSSNSFLTGTSISFAKPSYVPAIRMPLTNDAVSGHFQLGGAIFGVYGSAEVEVYKQESKVADGDIIQQKPMVGYLYYQEAQKNAAAVMDFTRVNDQEVTSNTTVISAPQYSYDVFSIQGEGTGGSVRAYRNDYGYVRDNYTRSQDKSLSFGADIGIPGHFGANFNTIKTPSTIGEWEQGNKLRTAIGFKKADKAFENVYFRNPGEISVLNDQQFNKIGGTDLVRFRIGGGNANPTIEPVLERYAVDGKFLGTTSITTPDPAERKKRTQVVSFLTAASAAVIGLDTLIKNYSQSVLDGANNLAFTTIARMSGYRKPHHLSQVNVTEADGKRYIYGIPVYNTVQKDFTFSVSTETSEDQVAFSPTEADQNSTLLQSGSNRDGFLQIRETPAYAHSFLLSGLLSPDYVDVTGNGITEDDLGDAVKFNYSKMGDHQWRTPIANGKANFNAGKLTENKDDKGLISYGARESWYLHSIESKTMVALFTLEDRADGKGVASDLGNINTSDASLKRLKKIDLYNKADLKKNGLQNARPVKTVNFQYSYTLCSNTPDNNGATETVNGQNVNANQGKLTLDKIYFTFNGQPRASKNQYVFSYGEPQISADNPRYQVSASDRWGTYKPDSLNPQQMKNRLYPYAAQPSTGAIAQKIKANAGAWALKKILLPSGSQLEVEYESDDYAFVQNKRAAVMTEILGFAKDNGTMSNKLYDVSWATGIEDNLRVYIKIPQACTSKNEVYQKYLQGVKQLAFRLAVNMPKGVEYITAYGEVADYNFVSGNPSIWVSLKDVDGLSPLSLTAIEFLREQLPGQAFPGYDVSESAGMQQIGEMLAGMLDALKSAFKDPLKHLRSKGLAQTVVLNQSFVRLNSPDGHKYGGGNRVRKVAMKDNWNAMTGQYTASYGQEYKYETTEVLNGQTRTISSGVASYEPGIGGEENPFQTIEQVANKLPMGPTSYGAIEMPVLDAFFPAPLVGYSKVTVTALKKEGIPVGQKSRSGIGKQVTEFYTAKDFPVYYNYTTIDPAADKQTHQGSFNAFFYKYAFDSRALTQGFIIATNDMHGKMKSQSSYPENDSTTRINYTENFYRNTGTKGINDKFDFAFNNLGGEVRQGNMGIDVELMTDTREFSVKSTSLEIQGQVDLFPVIFPFWLPFIWPVAGNSENTYRAVTTTKVISYHSVLDSIVVIDKGSQVSTKNLVFDAETGQVIVTRTNNAFDKPVYATNYPAYWAYSGMGPAYKNIDAVFSGIAFRDGKITGGLTQQQITDIFESGDELYLTVKGGTPVDACGPKLAPGEGTFLWAFDKNKTNSALSNPAPDFIFLDSTGTPYTRDNVAFRIVRSGKRNMLGASVAGATTMANPVTGTMVRKLTINTASKTVQATAIEFREKWQIDNDLIRKLKSTFNPSTCSYTEEDDCGGYLQKNLNPYRKGLVGNFRSYRNMVYYGNRTETNPLTLTNLPENGFLDNFKLYWDFNASNNLVPDIASTKWVWNEQSTRMNAKGMQLETKNALDIYTAAQYGFNKSLPVAITNNSRYNEMFYQGFEDESYNTSINNSITANCPGNKHIDLSNLKPADGSSSIIDVSTVPGLEAHSGRYVLKVGANKTVFRDSIPVAGSLPDTYSLNLESDVTKTLSDAGGNVADVEMSPFLPSFDIGNGSFPTSKALVESLTSFSNGGFNTNFFVVKDAYLDNGDTRTHSYIFTHTYYINVQQSGTYFLKMDFPINSQMGIESRSMEIAIFDEQDNLVNASYSVNKSSSTSNVSLCKGIYKVRAKIYNRVYITHNLFPDVPEWHGGGTEGANGIPYSGLIIYADYAYCNSPGWNCFDNNNNSYGYGPISLTTNAATANYKSLSTVNGCAYTKPIPASPEMLNSVFTVPAGKKMLFSTWVKEQCGNPSNGTPCQDDSYTHNKIRLQFNDPANTVKEFTPSGPIIDGWQRIEGEFTVPAGASNMAVSFVNSSGNPIYYDDIRIHPFNANMKSYVYDPVNLRLVAELDANNYATFYEYDEEGGLIRTKTETKEGIKTIQETRSFKQRTITTIQ